MKKAKKVLLLVLCAALLVGASVAGTLAYLTSQDDVVNTFTIGQVKIKLDEAPVDENGKATTGDRVQDNEYHLQPGLTYDKDPMVTVLEGSESCYVRMFVTINNSADLDAIFAEKNLTLNSIFDLQEGWVYKSALPNQAGESTDTRTYEFWYNAAVAKNEEDDTELPALFTEITMPDVLDNDDLARLTDDPETENVTEPDLKIWVVAQAIQSAGFAGDNDAAKMAAAFGAAPEITGADLMPTTEG